MNTKTLTVLAVVAVALIAAAAFVARRDKVETPALTETPHAAMFPGLNEKLASVAAIQVKHADKDFTIHKDAQGAWTIAEKGDFPAKADTVKLALNGMALLERGEEMTSRPDRYKQIGVQDVDGKPGADPAPTQVTFKDDKGQPIVSAIVGNQKFEGSKRGVYIRKAGEAQSWLAQGELEVPEDPVRWVDSTITQIPRTRIKSVTVTQPDNAETLVISRATADEKSFTVHDLPKGKELKSPTEADSLGDALSYLSLNDVGPIGSVDFKGQNGWTAGPHSEFRTFDGLVVACDLAKKDGKTWASFVANYEPPAGAENKTEAKSDEKKDDKPADAKPDEKKPDDKKPGEKTPDEVKKEVADLNARFGKWAFEIPDYKSTILERKMTDLLKSDTPPAPPPSMQGTTPLLPPSTPPAIPPHPPAGAPGSTGH